MFHDPRKIEEGGKFFFLILHVSPKVGFYFRLVPNPTRSGPYPPCVLNHASYL